MPQRSMTFPWGNYCASKWDLSKGQSPSSEEDIRHRACPSSLSQKPLWGCHFHFPFARSQRPLVWVTTWSKGASEDLFDQEESLGAGSFLWQPKRLAASAEVRSQQKHGYKWHPTLASSTPVTEPPGLVVKADMSRYLLANLSLRQLPTTSTLYLTEPCFHLRKRLCSLCLTDAGGKGLPGVVLGAGRESHVDSRAYGKATFPPAINQKSIISVPASPKPSWMDEIWWKPDEIWWQLFVEGCLCPQKFTCKLKKLMSSMKRLKRLWSPKVRSPAPATGAGAWPLWEESPYPGPYTSPSFPATKQTAGPSGYLGLFCKAQDSGKPRWQAILHWSLLRKARCRQDADLWFETEVSCFSSAMCWGPPVQVCKSQLLNSGELYEPFVKHLIIQHQTI